MTKTLATAAVIILCGLAACTDTTKVTPVGASSAGAATGGSVSGATP